VSRHGGSDRVAAIATATATAKVKGLSIVLSVPARKLSKVSIRLRVPGLNFSV
jgi:hypothetical protein